MVGSRSSTLTVAVQSFLGSRGGISRLCDLTAHVALEAGYPLSLLSVENEGGSYRGYRFWQGCGGSRAKFVVACGGAMLRGDHIFYDQLGTARAHVWPTRIGRPCGVWLHGIEVWDQLRPDRLRAARRASFMLANTRFTMLQAIKYDKVFESARVCWLGTLQDEPPTESAPLDGPPTVMILGRLDDASYKGHRELIEAWPAVVDAVPGARLVVVGIGPSLEQHRGFAAASRVSEYIDFLGFMDESAMPNVWKRTVVFAMPSRGEGFGLAYIEAMRWGVPVIASTHDAGSEVNIHNETGFNVDLCRESELADTLIELLRNRDLAQRMGIAGQRRWRKHFCYSAFRERFLPQLEIFLQT
jgi:phosphatidyl-myo-inositol dimannoside synthase